MKALVLAIGILAAFPVLAQISTEDLQSIVDSVELRVGEEWHHDYSIDRSAVTYLPEKDLEALIGRPLTRQESADLGETHLVKADPTKIISVYAFGNCVGSELIVKALDLNFQPVPGITPREEYLDIDSCPD